MAKRTSALIAGVVGAALAFGLSTGARAEKPDEVEAYKTHLAFAGYEVTESDDRLSIKHPTRYNFGFYKLRGGILAQGFITGNKPKMDSSRLECLEMVNRVNTRITMVRAYIDKDKDVALEAWYQPPYDRARFALFLDMYDEVRSILIEEDKNLDCLT